MAVLSTLELTLSALAGFIVAMLAARPVQARMWRALNRALYALLTLPALCRYAVHVDAVWQAQRARGRYAALIDGGRV